jgi:transcriptional regulator with XRE-family HTH domain
MDFQALALEIRKLRKEQRISQSVMAQGVGISRATISALENGSLHDVGIKKIMVILDYLGCELSLREKSPWPTFEELKDAR